MATQKKIKTDLGIFLFFDKETQEYRRVVIGDPVLLYGFFLDQCAILAPQLKELEKAYPDKTSLLVAIEKSRKEWTIDNAHGAFDDDTYLKFSYIIEEGKTP